MKINKKQKVFLEDLLKDITTKDDLCAVFKFYKGNHKITDTVKIVFGDKFYQLSQ